MKGLFVTGTDTGVGKTTVTCAIVRAFARRGLKVAAMKPCETGDGDDAVRLRVATGRALDPTLVCPYRFPMPASPEEAARAAGRRIELEPIRNAYDALTRDAEVTFVEGAGGLLVRLGGDLDMAGLARALALPLLIVARSSLGTVNHTLLTIEAARRRGLAVAGVIFSRASVLGRPGPDEPTNPQAIARYGEVQIFGTLPHLAPDQDDAALAETSLDLDGLWAAIKT